MLYTNLIHLETAAELGNMIEENENVLVVCGKMNPECIPVFRIAEVLAKECQPVKFCDMEFDNPESLIVRNIPELELSSNMPYIVYYLGGKVEKSTSGIQSKEQISSNINELFLKTEKV